MRPAAFLDRDGTLNVRAAPHEYITRPDDFVWLPGVRKGLAILAECGFVLTVVSNQRGVARGFVTPETLAAIEHTIVEDLRPLGVDIAAFRYCIHDLDASCSCRKPEPGLLLELATELGLDLGRSWMVGDDATDILAGRRAGCHTAFVGTDPGSSSPDVTASTFLEVSTEIRARTSPHVPSRSNSDTSAS